jgi:transposase, IS30 family
MYKHLTQFELYYIWKHCVNKSALEMFSERLKVTKVAKDLDCHRSTIYRAIKYIKATMWEPISTFTSPKFRKRKSNKLKKITVKVECYIVSHLKIGWSPEVISGRICKEIRCNISFKTIYNYIWRDKQSGGKLYKLLPHQGKRYKYGSSNRCSIRDRVDISLRPTLVEKKIRIGDLEGDTIVGIKGGDKSCLLTLVDRVSKYTLIRKLPNKTAVSVESAMYDCYDNSMLPFITVTYDNGTEFANHSNISKTLGCNIYFARPYRSCDRGLNEHTNGLIRRYYPKKTNFATVTDEQIRSVQNLLNDRPRKSLGFLTPNEVINKYLAKTYKKLSQLT